MGMIKARARMAVRVRAALFAVLSSRDADAERDSAGDVTGFEKAGEVADFFGASHGKAPF